SSSCWSEDFHPFLLKVWFLWPWILFRLPNEKLKIVGLKDHGIGVTPKVSGGLHTKELGTGNNSTLWAIRSSASYRPCRSVRTCLLPWNLVRRGKKIDSTPVFPYSQPVITGASCTLPSAFMT
ncbi:MAG: hypothetical protein ACXADX_20565, partial [Candidatus Hodarchaeales archaeon]